MNKLDLSAGGGDAEAVDRQVLLERIAEIGKKVAEPHADAVDRHARFPQEAIDALREARAFSAAVPTEFGGQGCSITDLAAHCERLGQHCSATAMIVAMHHIQVGCIVRHAGSSAYLRAYLTELAEKQFLIASVTSEVGVGGDLRSSRAAVETTGDRFVLNKSATTISYGAQADDLLVTARRNPDAAPGDQVLVLVRKADATLEQTGSWDTLGMRGTCSPGFELRSVGGTEQILPGTFATIATQTMVPYSHLLWCAAWCGIARGALAKAGTFVRTAARKTPGTVPPTAQRLAATSAQMQAIQQNVRAVTRQYEAIAASPEAAETFSSLGFALQMNNLKVTTSQQVPEIVQACLGICGIAAYRNDSPFALGRSLRDSLSGALMIANDRILATNASLLLVHKDN
jgi:acyl-CoA dehydrogenase